MRHKLFIGNDWVEPAEGMYFPDVDPATEEPTVEIARGTAPDVDRAVRAAEAAMRGPWQKLTPAERGGLLFKLADLVGGAREELAAIETKDMGRSSLSLKPSWPGGPRTASASSPSAAAPTRWRR